MANYIVRVEVHTFYLHHDYNDLHSAMDKASFSRKILGDNGKSYHLPTAEYICSTNLNTEQVRDAVQTIVSNIAKRYCLIVHERGTSAWFNLDPA
jgi:hypothetical protein